MNFAARDAQDVASALLNTQEGGLYAEVMPIFLAFTKVLLDALSASDDVDTNHDGVISMSELTVYIGKRLTELTNGDQQLGLDQRFQGDILVDGL